MRNPFDPPSGLESPTDEMLVNAAQSGDRDALERLIRRHQHWLYNLIVRVIWRPDLAEDATQEVLIKIVTKLSTFEGKSKFTTWAYRIAVNHATDQNRLKKNQAELTPLSFSQMGGMIDNTPDFDPPARDQIGVDVPLIIEESKIGCMTAMLMCLDRRQRIVFTLGELFGVTDKQGAELLELTPANFRKILSRSRRDLYAFMNNKCGLINESNPCRCRNKTQAQINSGYVDPNTMKFVAEHQQRIVDVAQDRLHEIEDIVERAHAETWRQTPFMLVPDQVEQLKDALDVHCSSSVA